eukprot:scaffold5467_cov331-Prasinococcus_capsulatus_cf.AAC.1
MSVALGSLQVDGASLLALIGELNNQLATVDTQLQEERRKLGKAQSEKQELVNALASVTQSVQTHIKDTAAMQMQMTDLQASKSVLEECKASLEREKAVLEERVDQLRRDVASKAKAFLDGSRIREDVAKCLGFANYEMFKSKHKDLSANLSQQVADIRQEVSEAEASCRAIDHENASIDSQAASVRKTIQELKQEEGALMAEKQALHSTLQSLASSGVRDLAQKRAYLHQQENQVRHEIECLQKEIDSSKVEHRRIYAMLHSQVGERTRLERQLNELNDGFKFPNAIEASTAQSRQHAASRTPQFSSTHPQHLQLKPTPGRTTASQAISGHSRAIPRLPLQAQEKVVPGLASPIRRSRTHPHDTHGAWGGDGGDAAHQQDSRGFQRIPGSYSALSATAGSSATKGGGKCIYQAEEVIIAVPKGTCRQIFARCGTVHSPGSAAGGDFQSALSMASESWQQQQHKAQDWSHFQGRPRSAHQYKAGP